MSRVALGIITASVAGLLTVSPAAAGCCGWGGWNSGWNVGWNAGWGTGCCATSVAPVVVQPVVQAAPVVVRVVPQPVVVGFVQPVAYPSLWVNQGPVYSGPGPNFAPSVYTPPVAVRSYPHAPGYTRWRPYYKRWSYGPRPVYRSWRHGVRPVYRSYRVTAHRPMHPMHGPLRVTVKRWH
ncbi:MAG: hypothetical protein AB7K35_12345 [Pseudorhodoplanes sp.]